jgi:hypothetical protein
MRVLRQGLRPVEVRSFEQQVDVVLRSRFHFLEDERSDIPLFPKVRTVVRLRHEVVLHRRTTFQEEPWSSSWCAEADCVVFSGGSRGHV